MSTALTITSSNQSTSIYCVTRCSVPPGRRSRRGKHARCARRLKPPSIFAASSVHQRSYSAKSSASKKSRAARAPCSSSAKPVPERNYSPRRFMRIPLVRENHSRSSTARPSVKLSSKVNYSVTLKGLSPARSPIARGWWRRRPVAPCSSTKSATCRSPCRPSSCARLRPAK